MFFLSSSRCNRFTEIDFDFCIFGIALQCGPPTNVNEFVCADWDWNRKGRNGDFRSVRPAAPSTAFTQPIDKHFRGVILVCGLLRRCVIGRHTIHATKLLVLRIRKYTFPKAEIGTHVCWRIDLWISPPSDNNDHKRIMPEQKSMMIQQTSEVKDNWMF